MGMYMKQTSPVLVIIAGLLFCIGTVDAQNARIFRLCEFSSSEVLSVTPTSESFVIQSPNYGYGSYDNNLDCTLTITSGPEPMVLSFEYRYFNLEGIHDCLYDYLCVAGVKFCGNWVTGSTFNRILPPLSNSTVHFHTDHSVTAGGFYIIVTSQHVFPVLQVEGSGSSSDRITYVPATYYPGMPYTDGCGQRFVDPNYGLNDTDESVGNVTNEQATTTTQNTATRTEDITAENTTIGPPNQRIYTLCDSSTPAVVSVTPASESFTIQSSNYPYGYYPNNLDCNLTIISGAEPIVLSFEYRLFNLEGVQDCVFDYLCVAGVKFCGNWATGRIFNRILPPLSNSTVRFKTDLSVTWNGFYIIVTSRPVFPIQQVEGSGSSSDRITYVPATYYPGMPYTDGCGQRFVDPNYGLNDTYDSTANVTSQQTTQNVTRTTEEIPAQNTTIGPPILGIYTLCDSSTPAVVNVTPASGPIIIQSSNYRFGDYPNNLDCSLTVTSGAEPMVLSFEYRLFQLEGVQDCIYDYLCVAGVKFCGNWATGSIFNRILPPLSNSTVRFKTDSSVTANGFYIIVTSRPVFPIQQVEGSGWSSDRITYVPATYYPGMPYTDGCGQRFVGPNYGLNDTYDSTANVTNQQTTQNVTRTTEEIPAQNTTIGPPSPGIYTLCDSSTPAVVSVTPSSESFTIQSSNYPYGYYPNNLDCNLTITSGAEPIVLSFEYRLLNLEAAQYCVFDYLCVFGVKFCGNWATGKTFKRILPARSNSTVYFRTDFSVTLNGFYIVVTPQPVVPIHEVVGSGWDETGITYVPANYYPGMPYTDGCNRSLVVPDYGLNVTDGYTGNGTYGQTTITPQNTTRITEEIPGESNATTPAHQDSYYFCNNQQSNSYIDINSSSAPFFIRSPNYGGAGYDNYQYCSLVIRSGAEPLVLSLRIRDFQVEYHSSCNYDYLCVHGTTFCGAWSNGFTFQYILPENSRFTTTFRTDGSVTQRGFEIEIAQQLARPYQIVTQPAGPYASSSGSFAYTSDTYLPGYSYSDRCAAASPVVPTIANIFNFTAVNTPTAGSITSNISNSTTAAPANGTLCYSAALVQRLNEIINNAIAGLNAARQLLLSRT